MTGLMEGESVRGSVRSDGFLEVVDACWNPVKLMVLTCLNKGFIEQIKGFSVKDGYNKGFPLNFPVIARQPIQCLD